MNWYTVRTQTNHEKSVAERLKIEMRVNPNIQLECLVPMEKTFYIKNGKKNFRERTLYPGWIFVQTNSYGEVKNIMKSINGCIGFLEERKGVPSPLREKDMEKIKVNMSKNIEEEMRITVGEIVKITEGPFAEFNGTIEEVNEEKQTVRVSVKIFGKATPVDLTMLQIEKNIDG